MNLETQTVDDIIVITLTGEMNGRTAPDVETQLLPMACSGCKLLLNMVGVTFLSSAGLRILLMLYRKIEAQDGAVALCNLRETIQDTMSITGFFHFFTAYNSETEGIAALQAQPLKSDNHAAN
jgi:anti-sigma B factor antagonist